MATLKNAHSPAGMHFSTYGTQLMALKDCPGCKYGTLDLVDEGRQCLSAWRVVRYPVQEVRRCDAR